MITKRYAVMVLAASLFASQPLLAQETVVPPDQGTVEPSAVGQPDPGAVEAIVAEEPAPAEEMAESSGATDTSGPVGAVTDEQAGAIENQGMAMNPGMPGPGKKGCRMGKAGMMGMMHGGMGKSCKTKPCCDGCSGISKHQYQELMGRLDVLDARLAKIDAMLERLLER